MMMGAAVLLVAFGAGRGTVSAQSPTQGRQSPTELVPRDFVLQIRRGPCEGRCPVYVVRLDANGQVTWRGERDVARRGEVRRRIPIESVAAIVARIDGARVLDMTSPVPQCVDTPTVQLDVTLRGRRQSLRHEFCWERDTPEGRRYAEVLRDIERRLDVAAWRDPAR